MWLFGVCVFVVRVDQCCPALSRWSRTCWPTAPVNVVWSVLSSSPRSVLALYAACFINSTIWTSLQTSHCTLSVIIVENKSLCCMWSEIIIIVVRDHSARPDHFMCSFRGSHLSNWPIKQRCACEFVSIHFCHLLKSELAIAVNHSFESFFVCLFWKMNWINLKFSSFRCSLKESFGV